MITYDNGNMFDVLFRIKGSVLLRVKWPLLFGLCLGLLVSLLHFYGIFAFPISSDIYTYVGLCLGYLLVFRTTLSYSRFWEGRGHLGTMVKNARDLGRQANLYLSTQEKGVYELKEDFQRLLKVYYATVRMHLRKECKEEKLDGDKTISHLLDPHEKEFFRSHQRWPLVSIAMMSNRLGKLHKSGGIPFMTFDSLNNCLSELISAFNGVDKVASTPLPFPYAQVIYVLISLYCISTPFVLVDLYGLGMVFLTPLFFLAFFGLNAIGLEIEDPFGYDANDLPLDAFERAINADLDMFHDISMNIVASRPGKLYSLYFMCVDCSFVHFFCHR